MQLRGELSVGGEAFVEGIRATPRASRRWREPVNFPLSFFFSEFSFNSELK